MGRRRPQQGPPRPLQAPLLLPAGLAGGHGAGVGGRRRQRAAPRTREAAAARVGLLALVLAALLVLVDGFVVVPSTSRWRQPRRQRLGMVQQQVPPPQQPQPHPFETPASPSSGAGFLDAWSLLLKEIRPPTQPGVNRRFTELIRTDRRGRKTLAPRAKADVELRELMSRLWLELSPALEYLSEEEVATVRLALEVSALAHNGQKRKSGEPFIIHPVAVAQLLAGMGMDCETVCSGLLHDTAEDTDLDLEEIEAIFGAGVRNIVEGETKVSKLAKLGSSPADYEETQAENLRSLFLAMTDDVRIIFVKLADRLHNCRTLGFMKPEKQVKIGRETLEIYAPLADRLGLRWVKSELEDLAFRYTYPREYEEISAMLADRSEGYEAVLASTHIALHQMLERKLFDQPTPLNVTVTGRLKEKYSLWRKMERKQRESGGAVTLDDIKDVVAMRIVINLERQPEEPESEFKARGIHLCYHILYLVQRHLNAPGYKTTVTDFVALPKPNGYRSLHVTIMRNGQLMEVQIRTDWMDSQATHGLASHWLYKDDQRRKEGASGGNSVYRTAWLTCLKEWQSEVFGAKDFVEAVRAEILGRRVSFFLKNGRIHDLPRGATLLDASFKLHKQIGLHFRLAEVNGLPCQDIDYVVRNGDVLFVVATRNARPSPSWAAAAQCRTTRGKIRSYFRSKEASVAEQEGRRLVLDVLARNRDLLERQFGRVPTPEALEASVRQHTGYGALAELFFQVALATDPHETGAMLGRALGLDPHAAQQLDLGGVGVYDTRRGRVLQPRGEQEPMYLLSRNGRETYKLCACCRPVDGDPLTGLRAWDGQHGEVVVVHRADRACPADARAEEGDDDGGHVRRRQDVNAERFNLDEGEGYFPVSVEARADRHRLYVLSNLVSALEGAEALLLDAALGPQPHQPQVQGQEVALPQPEGEAGEDDVITIRFLVGVRDLDHLIRVLRAFSATHGVLSARRSDLLGDEPVDPRPAGLKEHHKMGAGTALEDRERRLRGPPLLPATSSLVGLGDDALDDDYEYTI